MSVEIISLLAGYTLTAYAGNSTATLQELPLATDGADPEVSYSILSGYSKTVGPYSDSRRFALTGDGLPRYETAIQYTSNAADNTMGEGVDLVLGTATAQKLAFHNSTPVIQRAGAAQAAVVTTAAGLASYGYTEAQANAIVALVNELRAALVEKGIIKGAE